MIVTIVVTMMNEYRIDLYNMFPESILVRAERVFNNSIDAGNTTNIAFKEAFYEALSSVQAYTSDGEVINKDKIILRLRLNIEILTNKLYQRGNL